MFLHFSYEMHFVAYNHIIGSFAKQYEMDQYITSKSLKRIFTNF